ncbi:MAG: hypothetical protein U5J63_06565 [Fodinibius sp.]|nr:hypothetical protein [Fodinibius sp.]
MISSFKAYMAGIIDYAGLFPPADLSLDTSMQKYSAYRQSEDSWMLSRFIIPASRLAELKPYREILFEEDDPFDFSVLGQDAETVSEYEEQLDLLVDQVMHFHDEHGDSISTDILEIKLPREVVFANDQDLLTRIYDTTVSKLDEKQLPNQIFLEGYFDKNWKKEVGLILETMQQFNDGIQADTIQEVGFKLRCGGVKEHMVPTVEQVAFAINNVRDHNLAMKCTAGLHHPIRHYADSVQTKMFGFFNVFGGAMLSYAHDLDGEELSKILREEDPEHFSFTEEGFHWKDLTVSTKEIAELREVALVSFGSCSFDDPREDLKKLDLL